MRKSNLCLLLLVLLVTGVAAYANLVLVREYHALNLNDAYKNYHDVPVKSFRHLKIRGGSSYAIRIRQAAAFRVQLLNSRRGFFESARAGDTLGIHFTVPMNGMQNNPVGIIISCPDLSSLSLSGIDCKIDSFRTGKMEIVAQQNAQVLLNSTIANNISATLTGKSVIRFHGSRADSSFRLRVSGSSMAMLKGIRFDRPAFQVSDDSGILLDSSSILQLLTK